MALHLTPESHAADPPEGWTVRKHGRRWSLLSGDGHTLDSFKTKREAILAKQMGRLVDLYRAEGRWFKGESVGCWRPYLPPAEEAATE